jgi:hypothetical protein
MPKWTGQSRELLKVIKPYGFHLEQSKKHTWVVDKDGNRIISCSTTPSDRNGLKNTIRWMVKLGHIPKEARTKY